MRREHPWRLIREQLATKRPVSGKGIKLRRGILPPPDKMLPALQG
ncbi:hypothetical protein AVEN_86972-1, partial [Araneus ventricosus]